MVSEMKKLCGEIMSQVVTLNCTLGIDADVCLYGDTSLISVIVENGQELLYRGVETISDLKKVEKMKEDIQNVIDCRRKKFNGK